MSFKSLLYIKLKVFVLFLFLALQIITPFAFSNESTDIEDFRGHLFEIQANVFRDLIKQSNTMGVKIFVIGGALLKLADAAMNSPLESNVAIENFFPDGQDLDILVDGSRKQVEDLMTFVKIQFPNFRWDIGLYRRYADADFVNQHSDSFTSAALELTSNRNNTWQVIDLKNTKASPTAFEQDFITKTIHLFLSEKHRTTSWYLNRRSPDIMIALVFLSHAINYTLKIEEKDFTKIKDLILSVQESDLENEWTKKQFEKRLENIKRLSNQPQVNNDIRLLINELDQRIINFSSMQLFRCITAIKQ